MSFVRFCISLLLEKRMLNACLHGRWQKISDPRTIAEILGQVYTDHSLNVDKVFTRIVEITQHPAAAASFASIMFAPQGRLNFNDTLSRYMQ